MHNFLDHIPVSDGHNFLGWERHQPGSIPTVNDSLCKVIVFEEFKSLPVGLPS